MGKGDKRHRKQSIGVDLAEVPRKKARGWARMQEIGDARLRASPGCLFIYAVEARETEFVKIGVTRNLYDRLSTLQTGSPNELALLYALEAEEGKALLMEVAIHESPEAQNSKGRGEWLDINHRIVPVLFLFAAEAVGAEVTWKFGAPADEEPEDYEQWLDPLAKAASGFAVDRSRRKV